MKFTGKERDQETGLDDFGARQYSSSQGRFTTPDPIVHPSESQAGAEVFLSETGRWNKYAYVSNNPLKYIDPTGAEQVVGCIGGRCYNNVTGKEIPRQTTSESLRTLAIPFAGMSVAAGGSWLAGSWLGRAILGFALTRPQETQEIATAATESMLGMEGPGPSRLVPTGDIDKAAVSLASKLGGQASVMIEGFGNREFDVVSSKFIAQTFSGTSALTKPDNFLSKSRKAQIRETLKAAKATGRQAYFQFTNGAHQEVLDFIQRNAERVGVEFKID